MEPTRISYLHQRYLNKSLSPSELEEFRELLRSADYEHQFSQLLEQGWNDVTDENLLVIPAEVNNRVYANVIAEKGHGDRKTYKLWVQIAMVAAVVSAIAFGIWFFSAPDLPANQGDLTNYANDIGPGKQGATLTLANGKTIRLSDAVNGQVAREAGIAISKSADGQLIYELKDKGQAAENEINTLSTARGETYQLHLPDGSRVWLNAASSLTYTAGLLKDGKRKVRLNGEAYFEIAKDKQHPFIVETDKQAAEVLGTHFNINSYKDDQVIKTTLLEGSLRVTLLNAANVGGKVLRPGEESVLEQGSNIKVEQADIKEVMAWKNGFFRFTGLPIDKVMQQISRWYDIEVVYAGKMPAEEFSGAIARNKNISEVLNMLSYAKAVKFKVEGRRVTVMK